MRIAPVSNLYYKSRHPRSSTSTAVYSSTPLLNIPLNNGYSPLAIHSLCFKGYKEDKDFLEKTNKCLENSISRVSEKYQSGNYDFEQSLVLFKQQEPALYKKLISNDNAFKFYEQSFNVFNSIIIDSLYQVKDNKYYSDFWFENSKIGEDSTGNIISSCLHIKPENLNSVIKKLNKKDFEKLKNTVILYWYKNILKDTGVNTYEVLSKDIIAKYAELNELMGEKEAKKFFDVQKNSFYEEFNKKTIDKILNTQNSSDKKFSGMKEIIAHVEDALINDSASKISNHLNIILSVQKNLDKAINKESLLYFKKDIKDLYNIAINSWEEKTLPFLLHSRLDKQIYNLKAEKANSRILNFQNYANLSVEQKYFVSKYYDIKNNNYEDNDLLKIMIDDRNIDNAAPIIDAMCLKIENDRNIYFQKLDNFYDFLVQWKNCEKCDIPTRKSFNPNGEFSFINSFLYELGKLDEYNKKSDESKLEYLSTLTKEELKLVADKIKAKWENDELPFAIQAEVRRQANLTSINKKMFDELVKVNLNLNDIKIKIDNLSYSLKDLFENKMMIKDNDDIELVNQNSSLFIAEAERKYHSMTEEQKKIVDNKLQRTLPLVIDNLVENSSDPDVINELELLKSKCKTSPKAARDSFDMIKMILLGRAMSFGVNKGGNKLLGLTSAQASSSNLDVLMPVFSTAGSATLGQAGQSSGLLGSFACIDPTTAAIAAALALVTAAVVGVKKASNIEKQQREIKVEML